MYAVLIAIGAFFAIITTAVLKSITDESKNKNLKRTLVVIISLIVYIICCLIILQQKTTY